LLWRFLNQAGAHAEYVARTVPPDGFYCQGVGREGMQGGGLAEHLPEWYTRWSKD